MFWPNVRVVPKALLDVVGEGKKGLEDFFMMFAAEAHR